MQAKFFPEKIKGLTPMDLTSDDPNECSIQVPSESHMAHMKGMPAGGGEDQSTRITRMVKTVYEYQKEHTSLPVISADKTKLAKEWYRLFTVIDKGNKEKALQLFKEIPATDAVLKALIAVHPAEYLRKVIGYCISALKTGRTVLNSDILITPKTFEVLIHDIAATLLQSAKIQFSFGLPTHHAFSAGGSGFCIFNKTAVVLRHAETIHPKSLKYVIVGTDVNRDNGLCSLLMSTASHMDIAHVDIFDSRVYPKQDYAFISKELNIKATDVDKQKIKSWRKTQLNYFAVDLNMVTRNSVSVHPALLFALAKVTETVEAAKKSKQRAFILLPTGWDSHQDETAYCGKLINGRMMSELAAIQTRFNNGDLEYFFESIFKLYNQNKEHIAGIYWGLEGGYDRSMYEQQIGSLLQLITRQLLPKDTPEKSHGMEI